MELSSSETTLTRLFESRLFLTLPPASIFSLFIPFFFLCCFSFFLSFFPTLYSPLYFLLLYHIGSSSPPLCSWSTCVNRSSWSHRSLQMHCSSLIQIKYVFLISLSSIISSSFHQLSHSLISPQSIPNPWTCSVLLDLHPSETPVLVSLRKDIAYAIIQRLNNEK